MIFFSDEALGASEFSIVPAAILHQSGRLADIEAGRAEEEGLIRVLHCGYLGQMGA